MRQALRATVVGTAIASASQTAAEPVTMSDNAMVAHHLSIVRSKGCKRDDFKRSMKELARILIYRAAGSLPTKSTKVETPCGSANCEVIDPDCDVIIVPIMRTGLIVSEVAESIIPNSRTCHLGMRRNEETAQPVWYYNNLPESLKSAKRKQVRIILCDPMLATGGSASAAIKALLEKGAAPSDVIFVTIVSAPEGIKRIEEEFPGITIITAAIDEKLNSKKYIVPGLGDAGDRYFGAENIKEKE